MDQLAYEANLNLLLDSGLNQQLKHIRHGIEKESLRVNQDGLLAQTPHPESLGHKLTHSQITTDFSEAQLEFITPVTTQINQALSVLQDIHSYVYQTLRPEERLWVASMPCILPGDDNIPLAYYGTSNTGQLKTLYRRGLGCRYGRLMQTICGIHYNFSLPDEFWQAYQQLSHQNNRSTQDFRTDNYLALIRNFQRYAWLLIYLFGASPTVCKSFLKGRQHTLSEFDHGSLYSPYATSLRMGRLGYQSDVQRSLRVKFNHLSDYTQTLIKATQTPHPDYQTIGLFDAKGQHQQINTSILQTEAEYYGLIRPKPLKTQDKTLHGLEKNGIEYVEVRCVDLNPFIHTGIDECMARFIDNFLLFCLFYPSPPIDESEYDQIQHNISIAVDQGRDPGACLKDEQSEKPLKEWGLTLLQSMAKLSQFLDELHSTDAYTQALKTQEQKLNDPHLTPSAKILATMKAQTIPYFQFAMNQTIEHEHYFREQPLAEDKIKAFKAMQADSIAQFNDIQSHQENMSFEHYLKASLY